MPLLRRKPFVPEAPRKNLKADDEVFYCELTGEIFVEYDAFYQRMILCNSLVWSCELTGKASLTYKEAQESEEVVRKLVETFPVPSKCAALRLVHHTRRGKIQDLTDDIFDYLKTRYQINERVEVKVKDKWYDAIIIHAPDSSNVSMIQKMIASTPLQTINQDPAIGKSPKKKDRSPLSNKGSWTDFRLIDYKVEILKGSKKGSVEKVKGKLIRRAKGTFTKDRLKLFLRQTCMRTTTSSDDGFWVVLDPEVEKYSLGASSIVRDEIKKSPTKSKKKKRKSVHEMLMEGARKSKSKDGKKAEKEKEKKALAERPKMLTLEQKRKQYEEEKERKRVELETLKTNKIKEKEQEKARKKTEREKEKELANELKKLELDFLKEYTKQREDLKLEDSKLLPTFVPLKSTLEQDFIGDAILVVEFVNIFGGLFDLHIEIDEKVTLAWLEEALLEHDAEGKYYEILKFLLHSYLRAQQDENRQLDDDDDDLSTSGEDTPALQEENIEELNQEKVAAKNASTNARAAAVWPMLHQGMALREITIEPYSLTEILRLHILSSGVKIGGITDWADWQRRGQYQLSDDPCVSFRHREYNILTKLTTSSVYDLGVSDKLKLLVLLCNQALMLSTTREYMEDAYDKVKNLRKELREVQYEENKRRRKVQQEKWKKKLEERNKAKEEQEKKKKEQKEAGSTSKNIISTSPKDPSKDDAQKQEIIEDDDEEDKTGTKTPEEMAEERKRRKQAKEIQIEEFHRDKFLFKEKELLNEISKYSAVLSEVPLGKDRTFRRYWKFTSVDGLLVDNDDDGAVKLTEITEDDIDCEPEDIQTEDENDYKTTGKEKKEIPKVSFEDLLSAKENGNLRNDLILNRYKCECTEKNAELLGKSNILKPIIERIQEGIDPSIYAARDKNKWYSVSSKEQYQSLLNSLNTRGIREQGLKTNLKNEEKQMLEYYNELEEDKNKPLKKPRGNQKKPDPNEIDKNIFKTMDDYIEANLRDQLLELEERLWIASVGAVKCENREKWRIDIEEGMTKLILAKVEEAKVITGENSENSDVKMDVDEVKINNEIKEEIKTEEIQAEILKKDLPQTNLINGDSKPPMNGFSSDSPKIAKALPLHLHDTNGETDRSRCSTPVDVPVSEKQTSVQELAEALLMVERGIERKFLKPPLGETEEIKKERIREMIEAANTDFEILKSKQLNGDEKEEEEKKPSICLSRWEESLMKCTSFSQIFVHLNTLERSVMWDKSIQNVKCRLCKRKGKEEEMLLCDGCDRGFHMSCLKPPLKKVPQGDWFCNDCRPIEVKRRSRKQSLKSQEDTEEEEETEDDDDTDEEDDSDADSDDNDEEQSEDEEDEEEESGQEESESEASEHGENCTVCDSMGTLILCDDCPRSFHVECCYPPLKKVPRGSWQCQICTGADSDLPFRKRATTIEKKREKGKNDIKKEKNYSKKVQQRGQPKSSKQTKRKKSPLIARPSKRVKLDSDVDSQSTLSESSQRQSVGFGRQQLKQCTSLINEIFNHADSEIFLYPVDLEEVPDYANFIDNPMDFGTIKRQLNMAKYTEITSFVNDVRLVFSNCETYNPPKSQVARHGSKLKAFVNKRIREMKLEK